MDFLISAVAVLSGFSANFLFNLLVFAFQFPKRRHFLVRFLLSLAIYLTLFWFFPGEAYLQNVMQVSYFTWYFFFPFFLGMGLLYFCFKMSLNDALFYALAGWMGENFVSSASCDLALLSGFAIRSFPHGLIRLGLIALFEVGSYFLFARRMKPRQGVQVKRWETISVTLVGFAVLTALAQVKSAFPVMRQTPVALTLYTYGLVLAGFILCFMFGLFQNQQLENDNAKLEEILHQQAEMYRTNKENIDLINVKCHDLSKEIALINMSNLQDGDKAILSALEEKVKIYGNMAKTGNESLDVVLASKSLQLEKNQVRFTCMADGSLLSFMPAIDIFSLFGNALDNALEAELKEAPEKRLISMRLFRKNDFLTFEIQNFCSNLSELGKDLPTTKTDKDYHGFGIKGMDYVARKYGGSLSISRDNNLFTALALIPLKQQISNK